MLDGLEDLRKEWQQNEDLSEYLFDEIAYEDNSTRNWNFAAQADISAPSVFDPRDALAT